MSHTHLKIWWSEVKDLPAPSMMEEGDQNNLLPHSQLFSSLRDRKSGQSAL